MASILKVDELLDSQGNPHQMGKVLQVVQTYETDYVGIAEATETNLLSINITPTSLDSKFLVKWVIYSGFSNHDAVFMARLDHDGSLVTPTSTAGHSNSFAWCTGGFAANNTVDDWYISSNNGEFLYDPSLTTLDETTLAVRVQAIAGGAYVNRTQKGTTADFRAVGAVSTFTVIEIGA